MIKFVLFYYRLNKDKKKRKKWKKYKINKLWTLKKYQNI